MTPIPLNTTAASLRVYLTVDVEVWPAHPGGWPHVPLAATNGCHRELAAYFWGECSAGRFGLSYQLDMLRAHGLRATFFVDPLFSFALGIEPLREVVSLIQEAGQRVELHLHPEWLTDPRCRGLGVFRGPLIGEYPEEEQLLMMRLGLERLADAGATHVTAFRAGSWGAHSSTLRAVQGAGLTVDSSLNAHYAYSLADLSGRIELQAPVRLGDLIELPVTRFDDGRTVNGRPLSVVGVSVAEMKHVLGSLQRDAAPCAVVVLHSNEFVRTENLQVNRPLEPRQWVAGRFEKLCGFLSEHSHLMPTHFVADVAAEEGRATARDLVRTGPARTAARLVGQAISRWH